jgi:undecaprenyl-phosphate 4-deoxy-4-formamido-L-arabinose transferase
VADTLIRNLHPFLIDPTDLEELTSVTMFFRGFQLFATGIVGEYVGRIYLKLNQEPQYIIRELLDDQAMHENVVRSDHGR